MKTSLLAATLMLSTATWTAHAQAPAGANPARLSAEETFKQRDADNDGFLSKTEITGSHVADAFDKLDANKDGKLNLNEYKTGRAAMQGPGSQAQNAEAMLKERDINKNGLLSKNELTNSRMAERFDQIDTNSDGQLSLDELKAARQNMGPAQGMGGR